MISESRTIGREGAARVGVEVRLGAGEVTIAGGATDLLEADFAYNVPAWRPEVAYAVRDGHGRLTLRQPEDGGASGVRDARQRWDLRFADGVPLEVEIRADALSGALTIGALALTDLDIDVGTGKLTLDLRDAQRPLDAAITGGAISAVLRLPAALGGRIAVRAPVATVNAAGLTRMGDRYLSGPGSEAEAALRVTIEGGVATVTLTTDAATR